MAASARFFRCVRHPVCPVLDSFSPGSFRLGLERRDPLLDRWSLTIRPETQAPAWAENDEQRIRQALDEVCRQSCRRSCRNDRTQQRPTMSIPIPESRRGPRHRWLGPLPKPKRIFGRLILGSVFPRLMRIVYRSPAVTTGLPQKKRSGEMLFRLRRSLDRMM